jgi:hypothetical protein
MYGTYVFRSSRRLSLQIVVSWTVTSSSRVVAIYYSTYQIKRIFKPLEVQENIKKQSIMSFLSFLWQLRWLFNDAVSINDRMINEYGTMGRMKINREHISTRRNPPHCHFLHPKIRHDQTWDWTRDAAVGRWRLTAWDMARLFYRIRTVEMKFMR